ncbi:hypothetical protein L479_02332 [Exiguobacterium sp. S17]|nr:hypothetical protein L479_02332 [Exiguobacterium sp. S17]
MFSFKAVEEHTDEMTVFIAFVYIIWVFCKQVGQHVYVLACGLDGKLHRFT